MKYTQDMILRSPSGYCMPFEEKGRDVEMTLPYGNQTHPQTGKQFFHHGVDFKAPHYLLAAVASGVVTGVGNDAIHGTYQVIRYGDYEVKYCHLSTVLATFGESVKAGETVSVSGDFLHIETRYQGEELDPIEFLTMIYGNIKSSQRQKKPFEATDFDLIDGIVHTDYDADKDEIEQLFLRFFPAYMNDLNTGQYILPGRTEQMLRNILTMASAKQWFFEVIPTMENPMGMGRRSIPAASKVQNVLIKDFLNYLALRHGTYLSSWNDEVKKKPTTKQ